LKAIADLAPASAKDARAAPPSGSPLPNPPPHAGGAEERRGRVSARKM
jgi:hypothetical protein